MLSPNQKHFISDISICNVNRIGRMLDFFVTVEYELPHDEIVPDTFKMRFVLDVVSKLVKMEKLSYSLEEFFVDYTNFKLFLSTDNLIYFLLGKLRNAKVDEFFDEETFIKDGVEFI